MAYSGVYVFGDSLVDAGNVLELAEWYDDLPFAALPEGAPTADQGYFEGRFADGYTFADLIANKLIGVATKPVFPYEFEDPWLGVEIAPFEPDPTGNNLNFAYGGAHIVQGDEMVPDFDRQTDAYRNAVDGRADPGALYLITFGGNDVRDLALTGSPTVRPAEAHAVMDRAADKMLHEIGQLMEIGAKKFVIIGIADVGLIPRYDRDSNGVLDAVEQQRSDSATDYSLYLDHLIRTEVVPALRAMGADVAYVPLMDFVDESGTLMQGALNANIPTIAALHGLTADQLSQNILKHKDLIFYDHVHPTAQAHALLGAFAHARLTGTPWVETLPLMGINVDYRATAAISAPGEVDQYVFSLVAGTTYTLEILGISSLATAGSLADPSLRLLGPDGATVGANDDDGAGFDATLTYTAAASGNYTLQLSATGAVTGRYVFQGAAVSGAATQSGNSYVVDSASTLLLEGIGGLGQDIVRTSVSYTLAAGSEIEVLRTTNDKGKSAINLTGNEFGQAIIGNAANNVIEGRGGSDVMTGGAGKDIFVLSATALGNPGTSEIDRITDYATGEVVDVRQILQVETGTDVRAVLRVTTSGLIQVNLDGSGNDWATLSSINGSGAVTFRYLSGGVSTAVSLSRVSDTSALAASGEAQPVLAPMRAGQGHTSWEGDMLPNMFGELAAMHAAMAPVV